MSYTVFLLMQGLVVGVVIVASSPSPYFAALGLVVAAGMGCGLMMVQGGTFLSLVLFLIYLGGMLVVFAYSSALASELYPETWGSPRVILSSLIYLLCAVGGMVVMSKGWFPGAGLGVEQMAEMSSVRGDLSGVALMYSSGGGLLLIGVWALLLTLFVVLEVVRGSSLGALRAV